ncbi:hypothetical protein [Aestuariivivens insulae]|uniref:hypothetical protein n=1 Tax=Aestuariivivens insulae TaxID=1621988 RepID=UPI001F583819|nr:hypothetical protein [Aestuariivivens insulae]
MNRELPQQSPSEEVDLGQLFKLIGKAFDRLLNFIRSIFKSILNVIVFILKKILDNYKLIAISVGIAAVLGFGLEKTSSKVYASKMLVKPYFDSKYQLVTNVDYYNALIQDKNHKRLAEIFQIDQNKAEALLEFEIKPGPETHNDQLLQYENFIKQIDSARQQDIRFEDFIENRSVYSGTLFEIKVRSLKNDIFRALEPGLNSNFTNEYSKKKMQKRDSLIVVEEARIKESLSQIEALKKVYVEVMQTESKSNTGSITLKDGMSMVQERVNTREYELLSKELELRNELTKLTAQQIEEDAYFDAVSSFQEIGSVDKDIWNRYCLVFPVLVFIVLIVVFILNQLIQFVRRYEFSREQFEVSGKLT